MSASPTTSITEWRSIAAAREVRSRSATLSTLVHAEEHRYIDDAIAREKEIEGWRRSKKDALIEATNPTWADLPETPVAIDPSLRSG